MWTVLSSFVANLLYSYIQSMPLCARMTVANRFPRYSCSCLDKFSIVCNYNKCEIASYLNTAALSSVIAEALKGSFDGLRDSMNADLNDLNNLIASRSSCNGDEDCQ